MSNKLSLIQPNGLQASLVLSQLGYWPTGLKAGRLTYMFLVAFFGLLYLSSTPVMAWTVHLSAATIDEQLTAKFPKQKGILVLDHPRTSYYAQTQKITLCGNWEAAVLQREGQFCLSFKPEWLRDSGQVAVSEVQLDQLTAGKEVILSPPIQQVLNGNIIKLLDHMPIYKAPKLVGRFLENIVVTNEGLDLIF
jgi:hypothetical protein